ncbi:hypothetical protein C4585_00555 [Candidatus Parcubacteria bacterium]|nr:MAG: hypothetical protein C4585_00555 [Candidatus Parcubacteria bacterium]
MPLSFGESMGNEKRLPFTPENQERIDYSEKRESVTKDLGAVVQGLEMALRGEGEKKTELSAIDKNELRMYIDRFDRVLEGALGVKNFSRKEYDTAVGQVSTAKRFLTKYLSEKQFIALFGTDNLA